MEKQIQFGRPYVYYHLIDGEIVYVGAGKDGRFATHVGRSPLWRKIIAEAGSFEPKIIKYFNSIEEAIKFEKTEIRRLKPRANSTHHPENPLSPKRGRPFNSTKGTETACKNIRIYPSTLSALQKRSTQHGKSIARIIYEAFL